MFWIILMAGGLATFFTQFGAMSVTIKLLSIGINALLFMGAALGVVFLVRWLRRKESNSAD